MNRYKWWICVLCIFIGLVLSYLVIMNSSIGIDNSFYEFVSKYLIRDGVTPIIKVITFLGSGYFIVFISILILIFVKDKNIGISSIVNLICITLFNLLFKLLLERPRPNVFRIVSAKGYSFPSGHAMISMAFYGYLIYLLYRYCNNRASKFIGMILGIVIILLIGFSRIYLGVHYTSDVLAGFVFSIAYLILFIHISKKYYYKRTNLD